MSCVLYAAQSVRDSLGTCLRPGGLDLTRRGLEIVRRSGDSGHGVQLGAASVILDAGCGPGGTLGYLRTQGFSGCLGMDISPELLQQARESCAPLARASLDSLPLKSGSLDMVLCECALNLAHDRDGVLAGFLRVLIPGGWLLLSDIFVRNLVSDLPQENWPVQSCFAKAQTLDAVQNMLESAGFELVRLEDHSRMLKETAARLVFEHGTLEGFWETVTGNRQAAQQAVCAAGRQMPGLFLVVARKPDASA